MTIRSPATRRGVALLTLMTLNDAMRLMYILMFCSVAAIPAAAQGKLPAEIAGGVTVEAAWVRPIPGDSMSEVFLVVNNKTSSVVTLTGVRRAGEEAGIFVSPTGGALESIGIPIHAELYMTEGGVRVLIPNTAGAGNTAELQVDVLGGTTATFQAELLDAGAPLPDHHEYPH